MFVYYGEDVGHFIVASYSYMARYPDEFNGVVFPYSFFVKIWLIISLFDSISIFDSYHRTFEVNEYYFLVSFVAWYNNFKSLVNSSSLDLF